MNKVFQGKEMKHFTLLLEFSFHFKFKLQLEFKNIKLL